METEVGTDESVSTAVRRAVSAVVGREPGSLEPLTDVVDPAALDALGHNRSSGTERTGRRVSLEYHRCRVTVHDGERVTLEPVEETVGRTASPGGSDRAGQRSRSEERDRATNEARPVCRICHVCQRPIGNEDAHREFGELVHDGCRAESRCGISFGHPEDR